MSKIFDTAVEMLAGKEQSPEEKDQSILQSFDLKAQTESAKGVLGSVWEVTKETTNDAFEWLKKNKKDVIKVGIGVVGISLAYKFIRGLFGDKEGGSGNKEGGGLFGWLKEAVGIKKIAGIAGVGSALWLTQKILKGDLVPVIKWFEKKAGILGDEKAKEHLTELVGEKNANRVIEATSAVLHPVETLSDTVDKAKAWCAEHGVSADWLPDPKKLYTDYIQKYPTMATAAVAGSTILAWWFTKDILKFLIKSVFSPKKLLALTAITGLSMILFGKTDFIAKKLQEIGININDYNKDGKINFSDIAIEIAKKGIEAIKWLRGQIGLFLDKLGFNNNAQFVVMGAGAFTIWKTRRFLLGASKFAVSAAPFLAITTALLCLLQDDAVADEKLETEEDKRKFLDKYLEKILQETTDPEIKEILKNNKNEVVNFFMNPKDFSYEHQGGTFDTIVSCTNFVGDFCAAMGESAGSLLDALAENGDANKHTIEFIKEKNETGFSLFDIVGFFRAMYRDGTEILIADGMVSCAMKGARGVVWTVMTSVDVTVDAIKDAILENPFEGVKTYVKGSAFFIGIGTTVGGVFGGVPGALKGFKQGALLPGKITIGAGVKLAKTPKQIQRVIEEAPEWKALKATNVKNKFKGIRFASFLKNHQEEAYFKFLQKTYKDAYRNYAFYSGLNPWTDEIGDEWSFKKSANKWKAKMADLTKKIETHKYYVPSKHDGLVKELGQEVLNDPELKNIYRQRATRLKNIKIGAEFTQGKKIYQVAQYIPEKDEVVLYELGKNKIKRMPAKHLPKEAFKNGKIRAVGKVTGRMVEAGRKGAGKATATAKAGVANVGNAGKEALEAVADTKIGRIAQKTGKVLGSGVDTVAERTGAKAVARFMEKTKIVKVAGKLAGPVAIGYELYTAIKEETTAEKEKNEAIRDLKKGKAKMHAGLAVANGILLATSSTVDATALAAGSATAASIGLAGAGAVAIESWRYVYDGAMDSAEENLKQASDWVTEHDRLGLFHALLSTATDLTTGDKYRATFSTATGESILEEKIDTRRKIWEAILMQEEVFAPPKDPSLSSKYLFYRMLFIKNSTVDFIGTDFDQIRNTLKLSSNFATAMVYREKLIQKGVTSSVFEIGGGTFDLIKDFKVSDPNIVLKIAFWMKNETETYKETEGIIEKQTEPRLAKNPLVYALYEAGTYLGYVGDGSLESLQEFFNEERKSERGVYWNVDKGAWYVNEAGLEFDNKVGVGGYRTAINTIKTLESESDDVLEHRAQKVADAFAGSGYTDVLKNQTLIIIEKMKEGLKKWQAQVRAERKARKRQ